MTALQRLQPSRAGSATFGFKRISDHTFTGRPGDVKTQPTARCRLPDHCTDKRGSPLHGRDVRHCA
jgi:hypothetical protein